MKRIISLLIVIVAVTVLGAWSKLKTQSASPDDFDFQAKDLTDKSRWTQVNTEPYYISSVVDALCRLPTAADYGVERKKNPHAASFITVYVNNAGREAMFSKAAKFPEGSVIVKEKAGNFSEGRKTLLYTVMKKRERGYNPEVGDWEFLVVAGNGTQLEARGKIENCQGCHLRQNNSDFVFRSYVKFSH